MKQFLEIQPAGRMRLIAARFYAHGAYLFLPHPLSAIADELVSLREVWIQHADQWTERIALARGVEQRFRISEGALLDSLQKNGHQDRVVVDACKSSRLLVDS